jgi:hypothetical protein
MLLSCSSSSDGDGEVTISCSPMSIDVPAKGGTYKIMIVASEGGWEARASFPGEGPFSISNLVDTKVVPQMATVIKATR